MSNEYDLIIEDVEPTKASIIKEINVLIRKDMKKARTSKGIEFDVDPSWSKLLSEDGSIIRSFEKAGWKVRWFQRHEDGPGRGRLLKSWLCFQDAQYVEDTTKQRKVK